MAETGITKRVDEELPEIDGGGLTVAGGAGGMMLAPVAQQQIMLAEWDKRRENFRAWLLSHLKQGTHYGYVPGCEPRYDADGNILQSVKDKKSGQWKIVTVHKSQWRAKPSLYKAGALMICDLFGLQDEYHSDLDAWRMMGEPKDTFARTCTLLLRGLGTKIGEGTGAFRVGEKGMNENSAIKMADKRALVAAVLNAVPLMSDLFTQDMEDEQDKPRKSKARNPVAKIEPGEEASVAEGSKAERRAAAIASVKAVLVPLLERDCGGWPPSDENAQSCYGQAKELSGLPDDAKIAEVEAWLTENAKLTLPIGDDGQPTGEILVLVKETT